MTVMKFISPNTSSLMNVIFGCSLFDKYHIILILKRENHFKHSFSNKSTPLYHEVSVYSVQSNKLHPDKTMRICSSRTQVL